MKNAKPQATSKARTQDELTLSSYLHILHQLCKHNAIHGDRLFTSFGDRGWTANDTGEVVKDSGWKITRSNCWPVADDETVVVSKVV